MKQYLLNKLKKLRIFLAICYPKYYLPLQGYCSRSVKKVKEYSALIIVVVMFFASREIIRWIDPTAGVYDAGVLQVINVTLIQQAFYQLVTWSIVVTLWPAIGNYFKKEFNLDFQKLTPWKKICTSLFVYFAIFFAQVFLSRIL